MWKYVRHATLDTWNLLGLPAGAGRVLISVLVWLLAAVILWDVRGVAGVGIAFLVVFGTAFVFYLFAAPYRIERAENSDLKRQLTEVEKSSQIDNSVSIPRGGSVVQVTTTENRREGSFVVRVKGTFANPPLSLESHDES